jgi:hypothetical protein
LQGNAVLHQAPESVALSDASQMLALVLLLLVELTPTLLLTIWVLAAAPALLPLELLLPFGFLFAA